MYNCPPVRIFKTGFLNACNISTSFWMRIYFDHQLCSLFSNILCVGNRCKQSSYIYHDKSIYFIYLYSWCTIKTTILQSGLFLSDDWCLLSLIQPLPPPPPPPPPPHTHPPRPKTPFTHVVYLNNDVQLSKGHLGSRGGKHLKTNWKT